MKKDVAPIPFAGSQLGETRHVCAFFNSEEEEYRVLLPFIKDGFRCGHKAVHVVNPGQHHEHLDRLVAAGIDTAASQQSGQFELRTSTEAYLRDGHFDKDRMLKVFEQLASGNDKAGFIATMPSEYDLKSEDIGHLVKKYFVGVSEIPVEDRIKIGRLIEAMTGGTAMVESMHGAGSPQAQRIMIFREGKLAEKIKLAKALAGIPQHRKGGK